MTLTLLLSITSCKKKVSKNLNNQQQKETQKLFTEISSKDTGVDFINRLEENVDLNYFQYNYTYIGGGVATADFNNDGFVDLFFTSNSHQNKLYLNQGNLKFKDISINAGIKQKPGFNTGVSIADINNDGFLDIYICRGGAKNTNNQFENLLYINNGDLTFTEKAKEYGLNDNNRSINAVFFDFDNDNDLDVYVSNTPDITGKTKIIDVKKIQSDPNTLKQKGSDQLYENDGTGHFTNISKKAGIKPDLGFGLNPIAMDMNNDGFLDIYVCNDFNSPDINYINNGDGTFTEKSIETLKHTAFNSMGSDVADINNDGLFDITSLDMNPEDYIRSKTTMGMVSLEQYDKMIKSGYHNQYMHNVLQLNNGNGTFSDISQLAGIANTDWSWAILSADFDLDGWNDYYVTNGVYRDVIDKDKNNDILQILRQNGRKPTKEDFLQFAKMLPQQKLKNYFFKNNGDLTFTNTSDKWNNTKATFSNGAAYADLDNDGDLEIVVNNINETATILKNNAIEQKKGNFLEIQFKGTNSNKLGVGTKVTLRMEDGKKQIRELMNTRGFLSSSSHKLHFGLSSNQPLKELKIEWQDGKTQIISKVTPNQLLTIDYNNANKTAAVTKEKKTTPLFQAINNSIAHREEIYNDYQHQILLPHKLSQTGPAVAKTDLNGDGIDDLYIGGAKNKMGNIYLGQSNGQYKIKPNRSFSLDKRYEDVNACFFDADNDGDQDLYVVSGSYEFVGKPKLLFDRLYINNGKGQFTKSKNLPQFSSAGSVVAPADIDNDGDIDLFVGGRVIPGKYPYPPQSHILMNVNGKFTIKTTEISHELERIGMVTDAVWHDINNDKTLDLILCGEWMGIQVFINHKGKLVKTNAYKTLSNAIGWWNKIQITDIDKDGDDDIIAGNLGLNYKFHASKKKPFHIYTKDFDYNGVEDIFLAKNYNEKIVPVRGKGCTAQQMPHLKHKIKSYGSFANLDVKGIVGPGIKNALHYEASEFRSGIFKQNRNGTFDFTPFVNEAQKSPINSILYDDFNNDGTKDLLLAGNNYMSEIETTRADSGIGTYLKGNKDGSFEYIDNLKTGFYVDKDVRSMVLLQNKKFKTVFVLNNNNKHSVFKVK
ncbi:VCBS repeat-containing protein [Wenyingzhuangia sp. IMCC45574]